MLPTRALPPQFLLPAWGAQQLVCAVRRAHKSGSTRIRRETEASRMENENRGRRGRLSLFDELFPEENKKRPERELDKLPAFEWHAELRSEMEENWARDRENKRDQLLSIPKRSGPAPDPLSTRHTVQLVQDERKQRREASILVLNAVTKTLDESDFFRLSPKGEHIEGWTSGIIKVIPGRDSNTLEPLGYYFILFSSDAAARAYLDHTIRLHTLARTHSGSLGVSALLTAPGLLKDGEGLKDVLKGFSLVPGYSRLSLRLINRPYSPFIVRMLNEGGPAAIAGPQRNAEDMVLFSLDTGQLSHNDVAAALSDDGRRRNMHWKLAGGKEDIVRLSNGQDMDDKMPGDVWDRALPYDETSRPPERRPVRLPPRYIISFKDGHEARRFVREWHRRPFPVQRERNHGNEPPAIVNAEILW